MNGVLESMTPILLAALGGLLAERSGLMNIALEGLMLAGAFTAVLVTYLTGSWLLGTGAAVLMGIFWAALLSLVHHRLNTNLFISALALNLLIPTLATFTTQALFGHKGSLRLENLPGLYLGDLPYGISVFVPLALILTLLVGLFLAYTPLGIRLRTAGASPELLASRGLSLEKYRWIGLLASGALSALAGAALSLRLGSFVPGMSAGRGWIALVVLFLGYQKAWGLLAASLLFGGAEVLAHSLQLWIEIPTAVVMSLPFWVTLLFLTLYSKAHQRGISKNR